MPSNNETILIDVSFETNDLEARAAKVRAELSALRTANKELKKDVDAMTETSAESARQLALNEEAIKMDQAALKTLDAQIIDATKNEADYGDSLNEMRASLASLQRSYASLSKEERESARGTELLTHIQELRTEVGNLESSMGNNQRNVGNYTASIEQALKGMGTTGGVNLKSLTGSVQSFGKVFVTYPLNVITALLAAILAVIKGVTDAFKKNDDAMTQLQAAFSAFEPVLTLVSDAFQALAGILAKIVTAVAGVVTSIIGKLIPSYKRAADAARELVKAQDALEDSERAYTVNSAKRAAEISRLRNEAQDKDKSLDERRKALEEAIRLEKEDLDEQRRIATERLRIATARAKQERDTSDATKNNIADLQAAVFTAEKNYEDGIRRLSSSLQSFNEAEKNATNAAVQAAAERKRAADEAAKAEAEAAQAEAEADAQVVKELNNRQQAAAIEAVQLRLNETRRGSEEEYQLRLQLLEMQRSAELQNTELLESERANIEEKYRQQEEQARRSRDAGRRAELLEDMRAALEEQNALIEEEGESAETRAASRELQQAQNYLNYLLQLDEETRAILFPEEGSYAAMLTAQLEQVEAAEQKLTASTQKDIDERVKKWQSFTSAVSKSTQQIIGSMGDMAGESEKAAALEASVQMAEILTNEALALARGTAASQTEGFPGNIAALAITIAQITSQFATVFKTFSQSGFAAGGIVPGSSYTGDRLAARVNSGEMILNGSQQARLFELANSPMGGGGGGFDYETLTASLSEAVAAQPAPIMDYKEFTTFQQRTALYKEYANIRK